MEITYTVVHYFAIIESQRFPKLQLAAERKLFGENNLEHAPELHVQIHPYKNFNLLNIFFAHG